MAKVTVIIDGDERPLKKSVDAAVRELSRLEKAADRLANPYATNKLPSQYNTLSRQQFAEVQRISKERARLQEIDARRDSQLAIQSARARTQAENNYFRAVEAQRRRDFSEYQRIERQKTAIANAENRKRQSLTQFARSAGGGLQQGGGALQTGGATLTATLTAPLVTIATLGIKTALELDSARTKLAALEGDSVKAAARMEQLFDLADRSVGVTRAAALETFTQLKGIGGIAENTVNDLIGTIGKLNAAFNLEDQQGFIRNLVQIFSQGFERSDIKEAIGRIPIFEQLLESAFGTKDGQKLKALKDAGKLTLDQWLQGLVTAVNSDQRLANVSESLTVKLAKGFERLNQALAPLGDVILRAVIPVFEQITPYIQQAADYFKTLSPAVQTAVVAFGALLAAAGPILVILGSLIVVIGGLVSAFAAIGASAATIGTVALVLVGLGVALAPLNPAAAEFYLVWTTNFGGVRDFILQVIAAIRTAYTAFLTEFRALTAQVTTEAAKFWQENGNDILAAVKTVSDAIESVVKVFVATVSALWREHGEEIKTVAIAIWNVVKTATVEGLRIIGNVIKTVAAIINGDWAKAWEGLKGVVQSAFNIVKALVTSSIAVLQASIKGIVTFLLSIPPLTLNAATEIGNSIVQGIKNGINNKAEEIKSAIRNLTLVGAIDYAKSLLQTQSPSKVFDEIGQNVGEGLAIGIEKKVKRVQVAARRMAAEAIKELKDAVKEFQRFAGASPQTVATLRQADEARQAAQDQREIIDLRKNLGVNQFKPLPSTVIGTQDEVADLRRRKEAADELSKTYDKLRDSVTQMQEAEAQFNEDVSKRLEAMRTSGELALLDLAEQIDLEGVLDEHQRRQIENLYEIERLRIELSNDGWGETLVNEALEIAKANQQAREELERILAVRKQVAGAESLGRDLQSELEFLQRGGRELTEYERTLQKINTDYKDISDSQKEYLLNMAAQVDAQRKFNEEYEQTFNFIRDAFDILTDESQSFGDNIKNLFKSIADRFKQMVLDMAATWLTNKIFGAGSQGSGGGIFGGIFGGSGGNGGASSGGGNILSQILGGLFGGGGRAGGTPPFVSNFSGGGSLPTNISSGAQIRNLAGFGFLDQKTTGGGRLPGTIAAIGAITSIAGGLIGGRIGQTIGNIGTGVGLGATIGSIIPGVGTVIGAIVGGAIGFFASLFGDPKRKRDKNEKLPALQQGFADALKALRELAANKRAIQSDPQGAISQADTLRGQIASGFGIQFESSKYRKQAQQMIAARLNEADQYIRQIKEFAKKAESASLRPILPEFADGFAYSGFARRNGFLLGGVPNRDSLPSLLMPGEVVLNQMQQSRLQALAGFDILQNVGIPNYQAKADRVQPMATGGFVTSVTQPNITVQSPPIELHLEGVIYTENTKAWLQTKDGQKTVLDIVKDGKKYNGI
jgi:gas vesicle protein